MERLFDDVRRSITTDVRVVSKQCVFVGVGFFRRILNVIQVGFSRADVHHIVGDSHYLVFGLKSSKTVLTIHDCGTLSRLRGLKRFLFWFFWFYGPVKRAAITTTISEASKKELIEHLGAFAEKIEVVPNCVSDEFVLKPREFNKQNPTVLLVGTTSNKNVERVVMALIGTKCQFEVIGMLDREVLPEHRGTEKDQSLRGFIQRSNVPCRALGYVTSEALLKAYERCDFVIFASTHEGFGMPILEAQAVGRPVITSNVSSMPYVAGKGALLVDPFAVQSIREAVNRIIEDDGLRRNLIEEGLANVERFRPEAVAEKYAAIYRRVHEHNKR